jgi:hypothetical protein
MQDEAKAHLEYLLRMNQLADGFDLEVLKAQREILEQKMFSLKNLGTILEYEPIFTHYQTSFGKKK